MRFAGSALAALSAILHGLMVSDASSAAQAALMLGMVMACLYCAWELWTRNSVGAWCVVAVMNLGMVAVHWAAPSCHHEAMTSTAVSPLMATATSVAMVEVLLATTALWVMTRERASAVLREMETTCS